MAKHSNQNSPCPKCAELFAAYPGVSEVIKSWFFSVQKQIKNFHIAEAGRGKAKQEEHVANKRSRAGWTKSAHNWNCAIDTFFVDKLGKLSYSVNEYEEVKKLLIPEIEWYGHEEYRGRKDKFFEKPHFEVKNWKELRDQGKIKLVE